MSRNIVDLVFLLPILLVSMMAHEVSHGYVAYPAGRSDREGPRSAHAQPAQASRSAGNGDVRAHLSSGRVRLRVGEAGSRESPTTSRIDSAACSWSGLRARPPTSSWRSGWRWCSTCSIRRVDVLRSAEVHRLHRALHGVPGERGAGHLQSRPDATARRVARAGGISASLTSTPAGSNSIATAWSSSC